jgi:transcriptional regulator with XRE-family HTH domain
MVGRPTERDKRRGAALRQARAGTDLTQGNVAKRLGVSQSTIARIEAGERAPSPEELLTLIDLYDPPQSLRDVIEGLATLADSPALADLSPNHYFLKMVRELEFATEVLTFHSERLPMQLQSQQYALLQYRLMGRCIGEIDVLRSRKQRRRILTRDNPPHYHALLSESSLRRAPGGSESVVRQQAQHLLGLLEEYPRFSLQIMHNSARIAYVETDFTLLRMPRGRADMVYVPFGLDGRLIKEKRRIDEWERYWYVARHAALGEDESKKFVHELAQHGKIT